MSYIQHFPRERDCYVLFKGDTYTVAVSSAMATQGWQGGQGVKWDDSPIDEFIVTFSDGIYGGFMLWGSNESSDQFVSMTGNQPLYGFGTFCAGGWIIATRTFEQYTYASRIGGGPLVPIVYTVGQRILFSRRGYWSIEDEWSQAPLDPRRPNTFFVGSVVQLPLPINNNYIVLQTSI